jgi:hypothetical protein
MRMKIMAIVFLFVFFTAGLHRTLAQTTKPIEWGSESHGCQAAIVKFPAVVKAGEPVDVEVIVRHSGPVGAFITDVGSRPYEIFSVEAVLNDYTRVSHTAYADEQGFDLGAVKRGLMRNPEELKRTVRISRLVDMSRSGKYEIKIAFKFTFEVDGEDVPMKAEAPPFTIEIKEKLVDGK